MENCAYRQDLAEGKTLSLFDGEEEIFSSSGKWLHPLFEMEKFLQNYDGNKNQLYVHDTAIGKAALVLLSRMNVKKVHGNIVSKIALDFSKKINIELSYDNLVERLLCKTESLFENKEDLDFIYTNLRQRAKLVLGVSLSVKKLKTKYGKINDLSFDLEAGDKIIISGENGIGKTSLLKMICGIDKVYQGEILIDGKSISNLEKNTIAYVPQFDSKTVLDFSSEEIVGLGVQNKKEEKKIVLDAMRKTSCLDLIGRAYSSLSGGEKQKVNLARCLAQNAKLILLDEPTASLDEENKNMVLEILKSLSLSEIPTIVLVSHDKEILNLKNWKKLILS